MLAIRRTGVLRQLTHLALILTLAVGVFVSTNSIAAMATNPPGNCTSDEDGVIKPGGDGYLYECKFVDGKGYVWVKVGIVGMQSNANSKFASAELGYSGSYYAMLRGRATDIGPWEQYSLGDLGNGRFALFSLANNLIVSAEFGYGGGDNGMLRARAAAVGPWEQFYLYSIGTYWAFQSYYPLNSPCCYVSTELGYTGIEQNMLRARATEVGAWELYNLYNLTSYPVPTTASRIRVGSTSTTVATGSRAVPGYSATTTLPAMKSVAATCKLASGATVACQRVISFS